uniref:glutamate receptor ionotropic, kainate 2 isoform X2 n=1 Tax=Ciona intestinalis TaxID=7719 RepID=UPI000EF51245|nr:glutamate receptor ionotropic, kainate 2 isoform X2 [Ciona intestinalis]|eukprot:XP_026689799.1 glutamate receptor ionotropic, kainate 2 isoform X2 [Ciona intestinalis]
MQIINFIVFVYLIPLTEFPTTDCIRVGGIFRKNIATDPVDDHQLYEFQELTNPASVSTSSDTPNVYDYRLRMALEFAVASVNKRTAEMSFNKSFTYNILTFTDGVGKAYQIARQVCAQLSLGVAAIFTSSESEFLRSACNEKKMPNFYIGSENFENFQNNVSGSVNTQQYTFKMAPGSEVWSRPAADIAIHFQWTKVAVLYCHSSGRPLKYTSFLIAMHLHSGVGRVQAVQDLLVRVHGVDLSVFGVRGDLGHLRDTIHHIKERRIHKLIIDCSVHDLLLIVMKRMMETGIMNNDHHLVLLGMDSHLMLRNHPYMFGRCNITTFTIARQESMVELEKEWEDFVKTRLVNDKPASMFSDQQISSGIPSTEMTTGVALMYDAVQLYARSLSNMIAADRFSFYHRSIPCTTQTTWMSGPALLENIKSTKITGLTGPLLFDSDGRRTNLTLDVLSITYNGLEKIGQWKYAADERSYYGIRPNVTKRLTMFGHQQTPNNPPYNNSLRNTTLIVTTIREHPYVFKESNNKDSPYQGYCIDLLNLLSEDLKFSYKLVEVADNNYGNELEDGTWDGMIGEVMHGHADMAVAPLTINYVREKVVRFTKPYMSLGVSILFRKPIPGNPSVFGFLNPLSLFIWVLIIIAYLLVAFVMFFIARLSPCEWHTAYSCQAKSNTLVNSFSFLNSMWFGFGALMQQGTEVSPRSISTRLLAGVWWFFTLIIISSYTANLAAFLTVTRMVNDISSADDLASQTKIKYGMMREGSTRSFFENSKIRTYKKMWNYLIQNEENFVFNNEEGMARVLAGDYAYLMESTTLQYLTAQNCNLTQIGGLLDTIGYGIATMESSLRDKLSVSILKLQENGMLDELKLKWWNHKAVNCPSEGGTSNTESLDVTNLGGAFIFLAIGATVAITTAIAEFAAHSLMNAKIKKTKWKTEVGLGLSAVCTCSKKIPRSSFFHDLSDDEDEKKQPDLQLKEIYCSCVHCCRLMKVEQHKCDQVKCPHFTSSVLNGPYTHRFSDMIETVLNDEEITPLKQSHSATTKMNIASFTASRDLESMIHSPSTPSGQQCNHLTAESSDFQSSSMSLPGASPVTTCQNMKQNESTDHCCHMSNTADICVSENKSRSPETYEIRRWLFANHRGRHSYMMGKPQPPESAGASNISINRRNEVV